MIGARRATAADAAELVRLREVLLASMSGSAPPDDGWRETAEERLRARLDEPEPRLLAFVVDAPGGGLAACATGTVEERLGGPGNRKGMVGYVFNVATHPEHRRRGYSRACVTALVEWYREHGVATVDLRTSAEGEPLYSSLGFVRTPDPAMRLRFA
ncbi:GNAT family N-acetyltransferase [Nonomuraea sp. MCN248]|uniref:GNAT family N-acetyltransferase n=1 Tax=Nonomuraea corallina TaxID=2989783 RepID=A0ABT4SAQ1_9ACTN|nr:GNAT family N-acetyltransferase [Nonomuraea corallina]MDA0634225.1 GNAT family N-acetyltransferase [Nonomuraea corallina]